MSPTPSFQEEIVYEMEKICSVFPQSIKDQCKDFVETYGKAVIDMLLEATSPETVCIMLKCCTSRKPSHEGKHWVTSIEYKTHTCLMCDQIPL